MVTRSDRWSSSFLSLLVDAPAGERRKALYASISSSDAAGRFLITLEKEHRARSMKLLAF